MKNRFFNNIIFKDVKEFNIIFLVLIGIFLVSISGYSSYAIFSDEIVSNNEIKGIIKIKSLDKSGANTPILTTNMIPVYYDEVTSQWKKADSKNSDEAHKWYDYDNQMWANAVTVNETNRTTYLSANIGTIIPMNEINAMFVWIPRYKYTYFASSTPVEIPITFEKGVESTGTIKCVDAIVASSGKSQNCTDTTNGSLTTGKSTYTHPAFTFGNDELTGIWAGKFENSATEVPTSSTTAKELRVVLIKPSIKSWAYTTLSAFFNSIRNMELTNNIYGFSQSGNTLNNYTGEISGDSNNLDTHMMKNSEWGAVAYLYHSKYGRCKNGTCEEIEFYRSWNDYYAGGGENLAYLTNIDQSTTKNIYGIYDMSGGLREYVMGNMQDASNAFYPSSAGTWSNTNKPLDKYYDKYSYGTSQAEQTKGKLADATKETQEWYSDYDNFANSSKPWFNRGGFGGDDVHAGIFCFEYNYGNWDSVGGSRTVLIIIP